MSRSGTCSAVLTLVAGGTLPWSGSERGSGVLDVSVDLIDAPPGSTVSVGEPYVLPAAAPSGPPIAPLAAVALIGLLLVVLAVALRRRRA